MNEKNVNIKDKKLLNYSIEELQEALNIKLGKNNSNTKDNKENDVNQFTDSGKEKINLLYHEEKIEHGNFGDELSKFIIKRLLNKNKYELVINEKNIKKNIIGIGSYLHAAKDDYYIYGTGVRTNPPEEGSIGIKNLNVCAVRGPITYNFLTRDRNIKCPVIYGDPGLLLKLMYNPKIDNNLNNKIAFVPHKSNYKIYLNDESFDHDKFLLINPRQYWSKVVDQMCSCKCVISSSLHGLIISDTYDRPNLMIKEFDLSEGELKFKDYFISQKRKFFYITKLEQFKEKMLYTEGNKIDLEKLKDAFPFK